MAVAIVAIAVAAVVGLVAFFVRGGDAGSEREPGPHLAGTGVGAQFRYRRGPGGDWQRAVISAGELRRRGLAGWPLAVGVWWPEQGGAGVMVCRDCVDVRPASAVGRRRDDAKAVVLVGFGARQRVERRCVVHTGRFPAQR